MDRALVSAGWLARAMAVQVWTYVGGFAGFGWEYVETRYAGPWNLRGKLVGDLRAGTLVSAGLESDFLELGGCMEDLLKHIGT